MPRRAAAATLLLAVLATPAHAQSAAERAFEGARDWTVEIRAAIEQPFIEDQLGAQVGAGLVVDAARGWVLTNAHVAGYSPARLTVAFQQSRQPVPAERVYVDPHLDLAVIRYDPARVGRAVQAPELDCGAPPPVGHPVGAFGHPWGFRFTGTRGITSAVTSRLGPTMLQTDAPINAGNSGGPLISLETGRVVGVNAAKIADEQVEGLSFAVPMPYACRILTLLAQGADPSPPAKLVDFAIDEHGDQSLVVARSRLTPATLDLRPGDVVLGTPDATAGLAAVTDLYHHLRGSLDAVALRVRRGGQEITLRGRWPKAPLVTERRGVVVAGALFATAEQLNAGHFDPRLALMVHHVEPGSAAEVQDLQPLDLLVSADGQPVPDLATLEAAVAAAGRAGRPLELVVMRFAGENEMHLFDYHLRRVEALD